MTIEILHLMQSLEVGGMENGVVNIVNTIDDDYPSKIYCTKKIGNLAEKLTDPSQLVFEGDYKGLKRSTLKLLIYCYKNKPDIIHSHGWGTLITSYIVAKILRIKHIHGEHGTVYFDRRKDLLFQNYMLKRTNLNLFVSKSLLNLFKEKFGVNPSNRVIYNGVNTERFKPEGVKKSNKVLLGTIGRLVPLKNQLWLIETLANMLSETVHLMIVGSGPLKDTLIEKAKALGVEDKVMIYGESSKPEDLLNKFDIFILPSISEGLSNTIMEAMSSGLPIVASDVGGNSELIEAGKNGMLYTSNNESEFLSKLSVLINNEDKRKLFAATSRTITLEKFKLRSMIEGYQNAYRDVIEN